MNVSFIVGLLLAIPLSIVANLLTTWIQRRWADSSITRKKKRIAKLTVELSKLLGSDAALNSGKTTPLDTTNENDKPFLKEPNLQAAAPSRSEWNGVRVHEIQFSNMEHRFPTKAHNLRASVRFTPFYGEELTVAKACWYWGTQAVNRRTLSGTAVDIGMLESAYLVVLLGNNNDFFLPKNRDVDGRYGELAAEFGERLEYGEWTISIQLDADNYSAAFRYTVRLAPNESTLWRSAKLIHSAQVN